MGGPASPPAHPFSRGKRYFWTLTLSASTVAVLRSQLVRRPLTCTLAPSATWARHWAGVGAELEAGAAAAGHAALELDALPHLAAADEAGPLAVVAIVVALQHDLQCQHRLGRSFGG